MRFTTPDQRGGHIYGTRTRETSIGASDFLSANARIASLIPAAMRMGRLQSDCAEALPPIFSNCDVLSFEGTRLVLAVPTSAVAARLKQQLPKLQESLQRKGWLVEQIKLKVQVTRALPPVVHTRQLDFPPSAVQAFQELGEALPDTKQNARLIAAIKSLANKQK